MLQSIEIKKYQYIDILRGYAILMVLIDHFAIYFINLYSDYFYNLSMLGRYGVTLFFIVSAYTLTQSLEYRNGKNEIKIIKKYFIRRLFRIAPLYYLIIIFSILFMYDIGLTNTLTGDIGIYNILTHLIFIEQFFPAYGNSIIGVEWTITVEFLFYFLLPLIVFKDNNFLIKLFIISFVISIAVMFFRKFYYVDGWWLHYTLLEWFYVFVGGVILYKYEIPKSVVSKVDWILYFVIVNFIIMSFIRLPFQHYYMFFNLVLLFIYIKYSDSENLFNEIIAYIGKISFSLYLIHYIVLRYAKEYFDLNWSTLSISLIIAFVVSIITFYLIEQPFIKYGKYITSRIK